MAVKNLQELTFMILFCGFAVTRAKESEAPQGFCDGDSCGDPFESDLPPVKYE